MTVSGVCLALLVGLEGFFFSYKPVTSSETNNPLVIGALDYLGAERLTKRSPEWGAFLRGWLRATATTKGNNRRLVRTNNANVAVKAISA